MIEEITVISLGLILVIGALIYYWRESEKKKIAHYTVKGRQVYVGKKEEGEE